jgi:L-lactate dehydrogenase (cytochrome)
MGETGIKLFLTFFPARQWQVFCRWRERKNVIMKAKINPLYPNTDVLRLKARKRIPPFAFDYLDGGCNENVNVAKNTADIREVELVPQYLTDFRETNIACSLFGHLYSAPFGIAPIGLQGLIWPGAAEILARAAAESNIPFILSTVSTSSIETIAEITNGKAWFQLYYPAEKDITDSILQRAEQAGYDVLVLLADVPVFGYRPREIRSGLAMPPRMTAKNIFQILGKPHWALSTLLHGRPEFKTLKPFMPRGMNMRHLGLFMNKTFNGRLTTDKIAYIRDRWKGKLVIKGIASENDAKKALELGIDGIIVSNHGGRQLDAAESSIKSLERVRRVCANKIPVMLDSGMRSGPDIARAIASGADFTFMGRTFMYGVAALGRNGADHTIAMLTTQLLQIMRQLSCATLNDLPMRLAGPV